MFETKEAREAREAKLKTLCEALGLQVSGSKVTVPMDKPFTVDASAIDHNQLVPHLMYLAREQGIEAASERAA